MTVGLPSFDLATPATVEEAAGLVSHNSVCFVGGGTDLFPKMKRRQVLPATLVSLSGIEALKGIRIDGERRCIIGAATSLAEVAASPHVPPALALAAAGIASPQIRNTATVGGNLCQDTRCNYIDMSPLWRDANGRCMKDGGQTCWVAPRSDHCWAINSSDLAPLTIALGGSVRLVGPDGDRTVPVEDLYYNDGIAYLTKAPEEVLAELLLPAFEGRATYVKLARRRSIDFPLIGVGAAALFDESQTCVDARLVIGAIASAPLRSRDTEEFLVGRRFSDEVIEQAAKLASLHVRPQDNTDTGSRYRKWMAPVCVSRALCQLREQ